MSIKRMFRAQSELLQLTELYAPLGEVLSPSDTGVRSAGQRLDPERKAHNSWFENTLQRGNEPFRRAPMETKYSTRGEHRLQLSKSPPLISASTSPPPWSLDGVLAGLHRLYK